MAKRRKRETWAEKKLRIMLDKKGVRYQQHSYIEGMEVDFLLQGDVVVEVDGYVHLRPEVVRKDLWKEHVLAMRGYKVIRVTNLDVLNDVRGCLKLIEHAV